MKLGFTDRVSMFQCSNDPSGVDLLCCSFKQGYKHAKETCSEAEKLIRISTMGCYLAVLFNVCHFTWKTFGFLKAVDFLMF